MTTAPQHLTRAYIHLRHLTHNLQLLRRLAAPARLWPVIKADAYGHGAVAVARHLLGLGCDTLCVANVVEALTLVEAGITARYLILSATLPEHAEALVEHGFEPVVCTTEMLEALARAAAAAERTVAIHVKVDTGMGRLGIEPDVLESFLQGVGRRRRLCLRGLMSHFPRADEADKQYSREQLVRFLQLVGIARSYGVEVCHMANSAALLDLPDSHFDAVRPGIALYGLPPSATIVHTSVHQLRPVLEWRTRITFLKEVPAGTGLSYGHAFHTRERALIATVPLGYADGLSRGLSNRVELLVGGLRCPQVGRVTMDMSLIDVTRLRGQVACGDDVVIIGRQGDAEISATQLAARLSTINYEIVTRIGPRVPRIVVSETST